MPDLPSPAWPIADKVLCEEILDMVQQASHARQLKKGANETIKTLRRSTAELVILAADTMPIYIVLSLTISAEEKNCPYIYVPSKVALGRACGLDRPVIAASITTNRAGELAAQIHELREKVSTMAI